MGDLVERLNEEGLGFGIGPALLCQEAAAEITRLRVALAEKMVVKVKPLVWEPCEDWKVCSKERAPAFGGEYQMVLLDPKDDPRPSLYFEIGLGAFMFRFEQGEPDHLGPTGPKKFPTFAAAKAAAQADYTARILSAVDPDEITSLRAALADAQAVGFAAGVEAAAKRVGFTECPACGGEWWEIYDHEEHDCQTCFGRGVVPHLDKSALTPPDLTAAAARVLLGDENALRKLTFAYDREDAAQRGEPNPHTFIDLDAPDMGASWVNERIGCAVSALRALTEKTS